MNGVWEVFDFAWGDPAQNSLDASIIDDADDNDDEASGPNGMIPMAIEDGALSDSSEGEVPTTQPEQSMEQEGNPVLESQLEMEYGTQPEPEPSDIEGEHDAQTEMVPGLPDHLNPDLVNDSQLDDPFADFTILESPVDPEPKSSPSPASGLQPDAPAEAVAPAKKDEMPPPPPVDPALLERKRKVMARMAEIRLEFPKSPIVSKTV